MGAIWSIDYSFSVGAMEIATEVFGQSTVAISIAPTKSETISHCFHNRRTQGH